MVLKRRDSGVLSGSPGESPAADGFASAYPNLWEMISSARWPDGSPRVPSTLLLFCDDGMAKACLNDRDQGLTAWATGSGFLALLAALEAGLASDSLEWRRPAGFGKKKR